MSKRQTRRKFMGAIGGTVLVGAGLSMAAMRGENRKTFTLREGTNEATEVHVVEGNADGSTVLVVGGMHGGEIAGYRAAHDISTWSIDAGRLIVIPEANKAAVERGTRTAEGGGDLNRQFVVGETPKTALARAIWQVVERYDPDTVIDLHESWRLYDKDGDGGYGQTIFHAGSSAAKSDAAKAAQYVTENFVDDSRLYFRTDQSDNRPEGVFVYKAAQETDADTFLVETVRTDVAPAQRVRWQKEIVQQLVEEELFRVTKTSTATKSSPETETATSDETEASTETSTETETATSLDETETSTETETPTEPSNQGPTPSIRTSPRNAAQVDFNRGDTVLLDATASEDSDGSIQSYAWDIDADGQFEHSSPVIELTLTECQDYPITLRVTDDTGATQTKEITLSTKSER